MIRNETVLTGAAHPHTQLEVMQSGAGHGGYYLGFRDADGSPYTRETLYMTKFTAEWMLEQIRGMQ